jgi:hypothetical protein
MARRYEARSQDHFDLLPFIAILLCILGCLLLVTMSIAALSIGPGVGEGWIPVAGPNQRTKTPVLIEWDGQSAVIHQSGRRTQAKWSPLFGRIELGDGPLDMEKLTEMLNRKKSADLDLALQGLLDELVSQRETHYALFAVRPSGFENFERFADLFRDRKIDVGFEPIKQEKAVRLLRERK